MISEFFASIEEELLALPSSYVSFRLRVRGDANHPIFKESSNPNDSSKRLYVNSSDYFIIRYFEDKDLNEVIVLSYFNFPLFLKGMRKFASIMGKCFIKNEDDSITIDEEEATYYKISGLTGNKSIGLLPIIDEDKDAACLMYVNNEKFTASIKYDNFLSVLNFLEKFDLYQSSKTLLNTAMLYHTLAMSKEVAPPLQRRSTIKRERA